MAFLVPVILKLYDQEFKVVIWRKKDKKGNHPGYVADSDKE